MREQGTQTHALHTVEAGQGAAVLQLPVQNGDPGHTEGLVGVQQILGESLISSQV